MKKKINIGSSYNLFLLAIFICDNKTTCICIEIYFSCVNQQLLVNDSFGVSQKHCLAMPSMLMFRKVQATICDVWNSPPIFIAIKDLIQGCGFVVVFQPIFHLSDLQAEID